MMQALLNNTEVMMDAILSVKKLIFSGQIFCIAEILD